LYRENCIAIYVSPDMTDRIGGLVVREIGPSIQGRWLDPVSGDKSKTKHLMPVTSLANVLHLRTRAGLVGLLSV